MTYEVEPNSDQLGLIEDTHDTLTTEHGSDNVFVAAVDGDVVAIVSEGIGTIEDIEIDVRRPQAAEN